LEVAEIKGAFIDFNNYSNCAATSVVAITTSIANLISYHPSLTSAPTVDTSVAVGTYTVTVRESLVQTDSLYYPDPTMMFAETTFTIEIICDLTDISLVNPSQTPSETSSVVSDPAFTLFADVNSLFSVTPACGSINSFTV